MRLFSKQPPTRDVRFWLALWAGLVVLCGGSMVYFSWARLCGQEYQARVAVIRDSLAASLELSLARGDRELVEALVRPHLAGGCLAGVRLQGAGFSGYEALGPAFRTDPEHLFTVRTPLVGEGGGQGTLELVFTRAPLLRRQHQVLGLTVCLALFLFVAAMLSARAVMNRWVTFPLRQLAQEMRGLTNGDPHPQPPGGRADPASLLEAIRLMTGRVAGRIEALQEEIAERIRSEEKLVMANHALALKNSRQKAAASQAPCRPRVPQGNTGGDPSAAALSGHADDALPAPGLQLMGDLNAVKEAFFRRDKAALKELAGRLKETAAQLGAARVRNAAADLERACAYYGGPSYERHVAPLEAALNALAESLPAD